MHRIISTSDGVSKGLNNTFRKNFPIVQKLVTNVDVKQRYLNLLSNKLDNTQIKNISKLIDNGKIVPVECTNDYINQLNKHLKGDACMNPKEYENVMGFYTGRQNRLYILMDNVQRVLGGDSKALCDVTLHELQHMCCYNHISEFIKTWEKELYCFYAYFCSSLYKAYTNGFTSMWNSLSGKDKEIVKKLMTIDNGVKYLVQYLMYNHEYLYCCAGSNVSTSDCKAIGEKFGMFLEQNGCNSNTSKKICNDISVMSVDIFSGKIGSTWNNKVNSIIINSFRDAYLYVFKKDPWKDGTLIYQELIFPSEVIAISSQYYYKNNRYYKFLGNL